MLTGIKTVNGSNRALYPVCLLLVLGIAVASATAAEFDAHALFAAGAESKRLYASSPCAYDRIISLPNGASAVLSIIHTPDRERFELSIDAGKQRTGVCSVISRDGYWYADNRYGTRKYRPYEMPEMVLFYVCLEGSEPIFADETELGSVGTFKGISGDVCTFSKPVSEPEGANLRNLASQIESFLPTSTDPQKRAQLQSQLSQIRALLKDGVEIQIDQRTGLMIAMGKPKLAWKMQGFKFLKTVEAAALSIESNPWSDFSDDPTKGKPGDLIMLAHAPDYVPGAEGYDLDSRLMDVNNGRFRRIPFRGAESFPTCFASDRKSVIVGGVSVSTGNIRPVQIDLSIGKNRALGGAMFDTGVAIGASLSPDGSRLIILRKDLAMGILETQPFIIDMKTNQARKIGKPMDTGFFKWMPDGQHVIFPLRDPPLDKVQKVSLAVMDMDGNVVKLCPGDDPNPLADGKRILFEDDQQHWNTCDLKGQNVKLFADGMAGYGFPAVAPDGKRLLLMRFQPQPPKPLVFEIGQAEGKVITDEEGLWAMPVWR